MKSGDVPPVFQRMVHAELASGEHVVWMARPSFWKWWAFYAITPLLCIVALMTVKLWFLFKESGFIFREAPGFVVTLFIIPPIVCLGCPVFLWWFTRRTLFLITDRRAIYIQGFIGWRIRSFTGEQLIRVGRTENSRGNGSISFGGIWTFWGIADTRGVAQILRQAYENTRAK